MKFSMESQATGCLLAAFLAASLSRNVDKPSEGNSLKGKHLKIDVVAVADYALFRKYMKTAESYPGEDLLDVVREQLNVYMASNIRAASNLFASADLGQDVKIELLVLAVRIIEDYLYVAQIQTMPASVLKGVLGAGFQSAQEAPDLTSLGEKDGSVDAQTLLRAANGLKSQIAPSADVLLLFTGLDLVKQGNRGVRGIAQSKSVCESYSTAIVEFDAFHTQFHTAHELAHTLGSSHDGPECKDGAIMSTVTTGDKKALDYKFSTCSQDSMARHLQGVINNHADCLLETDVPEPGTPLVSQFPGAEMNVDFQCQMVNGPLSYFCRGRIGGDRICRNNQLSCKSHDSRLCSALRVFPLPGTPCGDGKWCHQGQCVSDPRAANGSCPYGDQTVNVQLTEPLKDCEEVVSQNPNYCYFSAKACCQACAKRDTGNPACKYGNKIYGCQRTNCGGDYFTLPYDSVCCGTCPK